MNRPVAMWLAAILAGLTLLAGCGGETPESTGKSSAAPETEEGPSGPDPERLPLAYKSDRKTLRECSDWKSLGDDLQHGMAFRAIAESEMGPVTEAKIESVRKVIDTDCAENPNDVLWNVAVRGASLL